MKRGLTVAIGVCAVLMFTGIAHAQNSWYAVRIGAVDGNALAQFYESAFGMHEVLRRGQEIMLNFGATDAAAKANTGAMLIVVHRNTNDVQDPVSHLIFTVSDIAATAQAIKTGGGKMMSEPRLMKQSGDTIANAVDPVGNEMELIQLPKH